MPPKAPREAFRRDSPWALLPPTQKPPKPMSIQLLNVLVPPSNICSGVSGSGAAGGALVPAAACGRALVSAAQVVNAPVSPVRDAPRQHHQVLPLMALSFI